VFTDLGLDRTIYPTMLSADELVNELQDLTKKLLGYGARAGSRARPQGYAR